MARRKGRKVWNGFSREEWLSLFADPEIVTDLLMKIMGALYAAPRHEDSAKHIASAMEIEYRALNAAVGWAGTKLRARWEASHGAEAASGEGETEAEAAPPRAPWEYVFDGAEEEDGTYLWILKPAAAEAFRELVEAEGPARAELRQILSEDASSFGREGSLFAEAPHETVRRVRGLIEEEEAFRRRALAGGAQCTVCGLSRLPLLHAVPYGDGGRKHRGLLFCPTHGALFAAHLISFGPKGTLFVADTLSEADREAAGLREGMTAKNPFSGRRMAAHRRIFNEYRRKEK